MKFEIKADYVFRDMIISALRYSIGRRTYIVEETISFIKENSAIIDSRMKSVMLTDLERVNEYYLGSGCEDILNDFKNFKIWLEDFKIKDGGE